MKLFWRVKVVSNDVALPGRGYFVALILWVFVIQAKAADTPMLERTVTIILNQEKIDVALKKIAAQGGFVFSYNPKIIDTNKVVTLNFNNKTIREVLDELFDGSISYKERRKYVILTKASSKDSKIVSGYILDENTGERLRDVSIYDPATLTSTVTDAYGYFQIKVNKPSADLILAVNKLNYTDTIVAVTNKRGLLRIPIKNSTDKIVTIADSVRTKIKRFWNSKFAEENMVNISDTIYREYQISVLPFIGTNHKLSGNVINDYSFNIYGGYSQGVRKIEIAGTFNVVKGDVQWVQIAGSFNGVYGKVKGFQAAGAINANRDSVQGATIAGLINLNWNSVKYFSAAGLLNVTHHESRGVMLAGLGNATLGAQRGIHIGGMFNFATKVAGPLQLAGLLNFTAGNMHGAQVAGMINFAAKSVKGIQISGLINCAAKEIHGVQLSGLANYATRVRGAQIGLINVSDSIKGVPLGLFSFVLKGYHNIEVSADEIFYTNLSFRTGVHKFYNIFTAGIKPKNTTDNHWTVGYGFGTAPKLNKWLSLSVDLTANQVSKGNFTPALNLLNKFYLGLDARIIKHISVTFGVTLNGYITDTTYDGYTSLFTDYNPKIISDHTYSNDMNLKMWLGGKIGVRFL